MLGDVAGKGFPAALLMVNFRPMCAVSTASAVDNLEMMLNSVNRLFDENTPDSSYASLFFAEYDDARPPDALRELRSSPPVAGSL